VGVGLFAALVTWGTRDCTDGTSNTIAFSERIIGDNQTATNNGAETYACVLWPGSGTGTGSDNVMPMGLANLNTYTATCDGKRTAGTTDQSNGVASTWGAGRMPEGPLMNELLTPNSTHQDCFNVGQFTGLNTARSRHAGGVNALLADGSVRFVKSSVNQTTWWALGSKAGGEVVSSDSY